MLESIGIDTERRLTAPQGVLCAHTIGWGRYLATGLGAVGLAGIAGGALLALASLRIGRHRRLKRCPYVVEEVVRERGETVTVRLRADGHPGHRFRAGQFAWLKREDGRLGLAEHPFSYWSSALRPDTPSDTVARRARSLRRDEMDGDRDRAPRRRRGHPLRARPDRLSMQRDRPPAPWRLDDR